LIFSPHGDSAGIAYQLKQEGNDVWMYISESNAKPTLDGIVPHVETLSDGLAKKPDVVFFDMVGYGEIADRVKRLGFNVIGSGAMFQGKPFQDAIELERDFGNQIMKTAGISIPETMNFKGSQIDKALEYVEKNKKRYVAKPHGNKNPYMTHVADDEQGMATHLKYLQAHKLVKPGEEFLLQEFVDGIELSTEMWFAKGKPVYPASGTMETKKFLVGDLGPNTGCQTSLVWWYDKREPRIIQLTLKKIFILLEKMEFTGRTSQVHPTGKLRGRGGQQSGERCRIEFDAVNSHNSAS